LNHGAWSLSLRVVAIGATPVSLHLLIQHYISSAACSIGLIEKWEEAVLLGKPV
jgi:hypothetical protein